MNELSKDGVTLGTEQATNLGIGNGRILLSETGKLQDYIEVMNTRLSIVTQTKEGEQGRVTLDLGRPVMGPDVEVIKGFYAQGQAAIQRRLNWALSLLNEMATPMIISGPGEDK